MKSENKLWSGELEIQAETCCEECGEVVHNHIECPICNNKNASTDAFDNLRDLPRPIVITCECGAKFTTDAEFPYGAEWRQIATTASSSP